MRKAPGTSPSPVLLGNAFPLSLIRRPVRIEPVSLDTLRRAIIARSVCSFWGHANTLTVAAKLLETDITPRDTRPAITLTDTYQPMLNGIVFDDCWILSPDYEPGFRPTIGQEVSETAIQGWQVLHITWEPSP